MTNLDIATLAQAIQDKSASNVDVSVTFGLGSRGYKWQVNIFLWADGEIKKHLDLTPQSVAAHSRLRMLAKHGYKTAKAAY